MRIKKIDYLTRPTDLLDDCLDVFVFLEDDYCTDGFGYLVEVTTPQCLSGLMEKSQNDFLEPGYPYIIVSKLTDEIIAAYEAPFPSFIYMMGPRVLPSMNAGIRGQQLGAWKNWKKYEKPFISFIGLEDDLLGLPRIQNKWINCVPGAKGQGHEQFENANHFIQEDIGEIMADRTHKFIHDGWQFIDYIFHSKSCFMEFVVTVFTKP